MRAILNKLDWLGFDTYIEALVAFYREEMSVWDLSELSEQELLTLQNNYRVING